MKVLKVSRIDEMPQNPKKHEIYFFHQAFLKRWEGGDEFSGGNVR